MQLYSCSKHNYTGINSPCPDCYPIEAANYQAKKSKIKQNVFIFGLIAGLVILYVGLFLKVVLK